MWQFIEKKRRKAIPLPATSNAVMINFATVHNFVWKYLGHLGLRVHTAATRCRAGEIWRVQRQAV
jgi:hypothetical protein